MITNGGTVKPWLDRPVLNNKTILIDGDYDAERLGHNTSLPGLVTVARREVIFDQGDAAAHCYQLISGCARTVELLSDGRRQINDFLFSGDFFGWEDLDRHDLAAEAVTSCTLRRFGRIAWEHLVSEDTGFSRHVRTRLATQMRASREHILLLGRKTAPERISTFLLRMANRLEPDQRLRVRLPMGRLDIADYLGLTVETVCRHLTSMRNEGLIVTERAKIVIFDRQALERAGRELEIGYAAPRDATERVCRTDDP